MFRRYDVCRGIRALCGQPTRKLYASKNTKKNECDCKSHSDINGCLIVLFDRSEDLLIFPTDFMKDKRYFMITLPRAEVCGKIIN